MTKVENKADWYDRIAWGVVIPVFLLAVISLYGIWVTTVNDPKRGSPKKAVFISSCNGILALNWELIYSWGRQFGLQNAGLFLNIAPANSVYVELRESAF